MEKLGVDVETEATKVASTKDNPRCPQCGMSLSSTTNVPSCPKCGTRPFEPEPAG